MKKSKKFKSKKPKQKLYKEVNIDSVKRGVRVVIASSQKQLESFIHFDLYRTFKNTIEEGFSADGINFEDVIPKLRLDSGKEADLVITAEKNGEGIGNWLVIEAKRDDNDRNNFNPYSYKVIKQAVDYATELGTPYFATCNRHSFILFRTFEKFKPLLQREVKCYDLTEKKLDDFAKELLIDIVNIENKKPELVKWSKRHEILIGMFKTLHNNITPLILDSLMDILKNKAFEDTYRLWLEKQGFGYSDERNVITAHETAYLLMNKIIFYKLIEKQYNLPKLKRIDVGDLREGLNKYFKKVMDDIDFEAVFEMEELFDKIPLSESVKIIINEFIEELDYHNLEKLETDLSMVYKYLIPQEEKKKFGQYYTDNDICNLIVRLCIRSPYDRILDPACGSGTFLLNAYDRLLTLKKDDNPREKDNILHKEILKQIYAVEINQFPAHLSVMQLALKNIKATTDKITVLVRDFFKTPHMSLSELETKGLGQSILSRKIKGIPPTMNAIIGNPPYIRQESIKEKEFIRGRALEQYRVDISEKSDIYSYFFLYGLTFLKEGGKFGFITSNSWLDVKFGEGLKKIFLDNYKINTIIAFDKGVFKDAIINTCITILEKSNKNNDENNVRFLRIKRFVEPENILNFLTMNEDYEDSLVKLTIVPQRELKSDDKWSRFHRSPLIYYKILKNKKLIKLYEIAEVNYPYKTSANNFFILDKNTAKEWGIEKEYLKPVIRSPRKVKGIMVEPKDIDEYILLVDKPKSILRDENAHVLKYIEHGEKKKILIKKGKTIGDEVKGYQNIPSFKDKPIWYIFEKKKPAPILIQSMFRNRSNIFYNKCNAYATHNFFQIMPNNEDNTLLILAFLNSSFGEMFIELGGRYLGNGLLELMVYEVEQLPILNPKMIDKKEKEEVEKAIVRLMEGKDKNKAKLDIIFSKILQLSKRDLYNVYEAVDELKKIRKEGLMKVQNGLGGKLKKRESTSMKEGVQITSLRRWLEING